MPAPWNARIVANRFLRLIFLQLLSSTFLFIPVVFAIKFLGENNAQYTAYFSFATNLTIGFTKLVLMVSRSLDSIKIDSKNLQLITKNEVQYLFLIIVLQYFFATLLLEPDFVTLIVMHVGIFSMAIIEFRCQSLFINFRWKEAFKNYFVLILIFFGLLIIDSSTQGINEKSLLSCWSVSTIFVALLVTKKTPKYSKMNETTNSKVRQNRSYLARDFVINYGLMQLIYSLGTLFTSSQEMLKYRVLMFLSIPTNIVVQAVGTAGLHFIFGDPKDRKFKLLAFDVIAFVPIITTILVFKLIGSSRISKLLGSMWIQIPNSFSLFLVMSLTSVLLAHTTMIIRWHNLTKSLLGKRLLFSLIQIPISILSISQFGANGILASLSLFNICFLIINVWKITASKISLL